MKERKKTWDEKCTLIAESHQRVINIKKINFANQFYTNLFFLNKDIEKYFENTDFEHQEKLFLKGLQYLVDYANMKNEEAKIQIVRLVNSHSAYNMNIHPHHYYYWVEALIMTVKEHDPQWFADLEYYWREVVYLPIMFFVSQYFNKNSQA